VIYNAWAEIVVNEADIGLGQNIALRPSVALLESAIFPRKG
jgi:hypothetical protein